MKKTVIRGLLILFGGISCLFFIAPIILKGIINIGSVAGLLFFGGIFLIGAFYDGFVSLIKKLLKSKIGKTAFVCACAFLACALSTAAVSSVCMIRASAIYPRDNATLIVLGCKVNGERPSRMLAERLEAAYEYLSENPDSKCVVSGAQGPDEGISEAECMYRYLIDKGIDKNRIYKEDRSKSTRENLAYSLEIIKENGLIETCAIATNDFHEYRASLIARDMGIKTYSVPGKTRFTELPPYFVREIFAIVYEWIF